MAKREQSKENENRMETNNKTRKPQVQCFEASPRRRGSIQ